MNGCNQVNAVVLLKWSKTSNDRVKGTAEVWRRGVGGCGLTAHTKVGISIFVEVFELSYLLKKLILVD